MKAAASLFRDLGHPVRLKILCLLAREKRQCVCRMLSEVGVPQPTLSRHLALLKSHGLIEDERAGTLVFYQISDPALLPIMRAAGLPCACGSAAKPKDGVASRALGNRAVRARARADEVEHGKA